MSRELMQLGVKQIPPNLREEVEEMLSSHLPIDVIARVIQIRTSNYLTHDSLRSLRRIALGDKVDSMKSPAELTLSILRELKGCSYTYISGSWDRAKSLITVRKGSWKLSLSNTCQQQENLNEESVSAETVSAKNDDERTRYIGNLLSGLSIGE